MTFLRKMAICFDPAGVDPLYRLHPVVSPATQARPPATPLECLRHSTGSFIRSTHSGNHVSGLRCLRHSTGSFIRSAHSGDHVSGLRCLRHATGSYHPLRPEMGSCP